jgi:hypothetical protein
MRERQQGHGGTSRQEEGVTIGCCTRHNFSPNDGAASWLWIYHHRLAQNSVQVLRYQPGSRINTTPRWIGHHKADGFDWPFLSEA